MPRASQRNPRTLALALLLMASTSLLHAAPACRQPAPRAVLERFVPADCESCWQAASPKPAARAWAIDWIVPAGDGAPMAVAALPEAVERRATRLQAQPLPRVPPLRLHVADGPAWNGYVGLQLAVTRRGAYPAGASAYVALVERVPAGSDGTAIDRQLVRIVIGPLPLGELATLRTVRHLRTVRLPEGAQPERLASVGWVESADGRVLAAVQSPAAGCVGPR